MAIIDLLIIVFNLFGAIGDLALWLIEHWPLVMLLL